MRVRPIRPLSIFLCCLTGRRMHRIRYVARYRLTLCAAVSLGCAGGVVAAAPAEPAPQNQSAPPQPPLTVANRFVGQRTAPPRDSLATTGAVQLATGESPWRPGVDFLKLVPTVWDDTRVLDGVVGQHIVMARKSGDAWYLGALTNSQPRELRVDLGFLGTGRWKMRLWKDAADAEENAEHLAIEERTVRSGDSLRLRLAPAGGCVARLERQ